MNGPIYTILWKTIRKFDSVKRDKQELSNTYLPIIIFGVHILDPGGTDYTHTHFFIFSGVAALLESRADMLKEYFSISIEGGEEGGKTTSQFLWGVSPLYASIIPLTSCRWEALHHSTHFG